MWRINNEVGAHYYSIKIGETRGSILQFFSKKKKKTKLCRFDCIGMVTPELPINDGLRCHQPPPSPNGTQGWWNVLRCHVSRVTLPHMTYYSFLKRSHSYPFGLRHVLQHKEKTRAGAPNGGGTNPNVHPRSKPSRVNNIYSYALNVWIHSVYTVYPPQQPPLRHSEDECL